MEYRMYGYVPYNISDIQKGIQFGHATDVYGDLYRDSYIYNDWVKNHKTYIILNGGTTNNNLAKLGTLNKLREDFINIGVTMASFNEVDLGDQLTAFCFILDERCFNYSLYPVISNGSEFEFFSNGDVYDEICGMFNTYDYNELSKILKIRDIVRNSKLA